MSVQAVTVCRTIDDVRAALEPLRSDGRTIGFVPTMGALHEGHLSLIRQAADESDVVVVSIFVNPTQFNEQTDLAAYPRELERDIRLAADAGAELVFAPEAQELYPDGFSTEVRVCGPLTETLEGAHRGSAHFHGVTTIITKLLSIVHPDTAIFGAKDAQQLLVIERLVRDLNLPVQILRGDTVREADGLAMSSRNARLSPAAREQATAIGKALFAAAEAHGCGESPIAAAKHTLKAAGIEPEYLALRDAATLGPATTGGASLVLVAATVDGVRLIDNVRLNPEPES